MIKKILFFTLLSVILFISGFTVAFFSKNKWVACDEGVIVDNDELFQSGWRAAEKRLSENGFVAGDTLSGREYSHLSGVIIEVSESEIIINANPLYPLEDPEKRIKTVLVNDNTEIGLFSMRTSGEGDAEEVRYSTSDLIIGMDVLVTPVEEFEENEVITAKVILLNK